MSITQIGIDGEKMARLFIKENYSYDTLFQADWLLKIDGSWVVIEVKRKAPFAPPPFWGTGLNISQVKSRLEFYHDTGIRCLLLYFNTKDGKVYTNWLDVLEEGQKYDTKNGIRIYPLDNFKCLGDAPRLK